MSYRSLSDCIKDLRKHHMLIDIEEEVNAYLEASHIHLLVQQAGGPALFFHKIGGTRYPAVSNLFGEEGRVYYIFRETLEKVKSIIDIQVRKKDLLFSLRQFIPLVPSLLYAFPRQVKRFEHHAISLGDIPFIHAWPRDGGAFITLPQVYTEDVSRPGIWHSNIGMYRIQLSGNEYGENEVGMHYQIHRGIGVHHTLAMEKGVTLKVSVFVGGPPAHTLAAVMPLPEDVPEVVFAGMMAGRRFRYFRQKGYTYSADADFVITGEIIPDCLKPEGPFGDHLGYYSLQHPFPVMKVTGVWAKKQEAIWPFTVVGRPPQEDTWFGKVVHELAGKALGVEIPGLQSIHAVDEAGVHPLLLAVGSERYTPFYDLNEPQELLTIAHHILGTGQLSLAKYLFITAPERNTGAPDVHHVKDFFEFILRRVNMKRDLHFITHTTIDTLDYSGTAFNKGSKLIVAVYGRPLRGLSYEIPDLSFCEEILDASFVQPGLLALQVKPFETYEKERKFITELVKKLETIRWEEIPMLILCDNAKRITQTYADFLWETFTKSDPASDIYGIGEFYERKHWGCISMLIDARRKPHHAPELEMDKATLERIKRIHARPGTALYTVLKDVL